MTMQSTFKFSLAKPEKQFILGVIQCQPDKIYCTISIAQFCHCDKGTEQSGKVSGGCCAQGRMRCFLQKASSLKWRKSIKDILTTHASKSRAQWKCSGRWPASCKLTDIN